MTKDARERSFWMTQRLLAQDDAVSDLHVIPKGSFFLEPPGLRDDFLRLPILVGDKDVVGRKGTTLQNFDSDPPTGLALTSSQPLLKSLF
jgi:hypothetical protein